MPVVWDSVLASLSVMGAGWPEAEDGHFCPLSLPFSPFPPAPVHLLSNTLNSFNGE